MNNKTKQKELYYLGYYNYKIDGIFGNISKKATRDFQRDYDLVVDGIFGKNTINKMLNVWKDIQRKLNIINNSNLKIDGLVGVKTIGQINTFQKNNDLVINSILDKNNLKKMEEILVPFTNKPMFPLNYIGITQVYKTKSHNGIDLGWNRNYGGPNQNIIAPLDMKILVNSTAKDAGNYVVGVSIYNTINDILFRFLHLEDKSGLRINQIIKQGDIIGKMGSTGRSTGNHLHFETWLVPKNYTYKFSDRYKYLKDPLDYTYIYPEQIVSKNNTYNLLYF